MLDLRPNCECCDRDLPPDAANAMICTFECTFCADCAEEKLGGTCPNCGGELVRRPVRPAAKLAPLPGLHHARLQAAGLCGSNAMKPGEIIPAEGTIELNQGQNSIVLTVSNTGDRPIQVGCTLPFLRDQSGRLTFDREAAPRGMRARHPAGNCRALRARPDRATVTARALHGRCAQRPRLPGQVRHRASSGRIAKVELSNDGLHG